MSDCITIDIIRQKCDTNRKLQIDIQITPESSDHEKEFMSYRSQKSASKVKELLSVDSPTAAFP